MTDLTEQWKKGELINGKKYYITFLDSEPFEATFRTFEAMIPYWKFEANNRQYCNENGYDCVKVLAPVPSYEEYLALQSDSLAKKEGEEINAELEAENAKLKELLKEYKDITAIALLYTKDDKEFEKAKNIRERIDEVLK